MADKKISALPAATTPLAGTEVLPIVQGGTTDQVSVANLTVGRDVSAKTLTGESTGAGGVTEIFARNTAGPERVQIISRNSAGISYVQTQNSQMLIGSFDNFAVQFMVNNSSKVVLETNSDVKVSTGNLVIGTAGKGIDFSANTHAAGMTSELLNWYEEGTWTPTQGAGLTVVGAFSSRGRYTRVGRLVQVSGTVLGATSVAVTAGTILCAGLPFASNGTQGSAGSMCNDSINASGAVFTSISNVYATDSIGATAAIPFTVTYFI